MSKEIHTQKHMTLSDRIFIEQSLADHCPFKDITSVLKGSLYNLQRNQETQNFTKRVPLRPEKQLCPSFLLSVCKYLGRKTVP